MSTIKNEKIGTRYSTVRRGLLSPAVMLMCVENIKGRLS